MAELDSWDVVFIAFAFLFQIILMVHFWLRKWKFDYAMRFGPIVYALSILFAAISIILLVAGKSWSFWVGGFIYLAWAVFGFIVEYRYKISWRRLPIEWSIVGPYILLYLGANMFYWFPLALLYKPLWYVYAVLFAANTYLNITSHKVRAAQAA